MSRLAPKKAVAVATAWTPSVREACDRCGFSRNDGRLISYARFRVRTTVGDIYLCMHHWRKHWQHIAERAYETTEL